VGQQANDKGGGGETGNCVLCETTVKVNASKAATFLGPLYKRVLLGDVPEIIPTTKQRIEHPYATQLHKERCARVNVSSRSNAFGEASLVSHLTRPERCTPRSVSQAEPFQRNSSCTLPGRLKLHHRTLL
jgi:hypothetical protein